jgi:hypothetical protein
MGTAVNFRLAVAERPHRDRGRVPQPGMSTMRDMVSGVAVRWKFTRNGYSATSTTGWRVAGMSMPCLSVMSASSHSLSATVIWPVLRRPARPRAPRPRRIGNEDGARMRRTPATPRISPRRGIGCRPHGTRKLCKRYALRAVGAPRFHLVRFRWSEVICGQGRGRTADLPLFSSTALSAVQTCENGLH